MKNKMDIMHVGFFLWFLVSGILPGMGQPFFKDTLQISMSEADSIFLTRNLLLIAQKLNVDATQALILQAKLYPNPNLGIEQGAYNPVTKKWFEQDFANGEQAYQFSQMIVLSRKIHKQVQLAETNYKLAEDNLYD